MAPKPTRTADHSASDLPEPRRSRDERIDSSLGTLVHAGHLPGQCPACGSSAITELSMVLTDGTPVLFSSCRGCEHRRWEADGLELQIGDVLDRTRG